MSIASTEKRRNGSSQTEEHTIWFRVTAWGRQAESAAEYLAKGRQVYVEGRLRLEEYTDRDGNLRISPEVNASDIQFLGLRLESAERAADKSEENSQVDNTVETEEVSKPATSRSVKKTASKRASAKEAAGIVDDEVPF